MIEPTFDASGYPTEETLERIAKWPAPPTLLEVDRWLDFATDAWNTQYGVVVFRGIEGGSVRELITCGWSGNEDIIGAMTENALFWTMCWQKSERGGKHTFRCAEAPKEGW